MTMHVTVTFSPEFMASFKAIADALASIALSLKPDLATHAEIKLGSPKMPHILNNKKKKLGGTNITFPQLASDGATLNLLDAGGNLVTTPLDPTKTTVAWTSSDPTVITVTVDPTNQQLATAKSTGKIGSNVTLTATFTNVDGSTPLPPAVSDGIDVPAGPPASATITLGVPA